jgi:predicted DNA-binding transcriptional regulator YafY
MSIYYKLKFEPDAEIAQALVSEWTTDDKSRQIDLGDFFLKLPREYKRAFSQLWDIIRLFTINRIDITKIEVIKSNIRDFSTEEKSKGYNNTDIDMSAKKKREKSYNEVMNEVKRFIQIEKTIGTDVEDTEDEEENTTPKFVE